MKAFVLSAANRDFFRKLSILIIGGVLLCGFVSATLFFNPILDTINIVTTENTPYSDCLNLEELEGNFVATQVWFQPINATGTLSVDASTPCYTFTPNLGETGNLIDTMGLIVCDDLGICDSTLIIASVEPNDCASFIDNSGPILIEVEDCFELGSYCLPLAPNELSAYLISDNGNPYFQGFVPCDISNALIYPTDVIFLQGNGGPYELLNWTENGETHTLESFTTLQELVDQMNIWDPAGTWVLTNEGKITGGTSLDVYGPLEFVQLVFPFNNFTINLSSVDIPNGSQIAVDTGFHEIIINQFFTGCRDTILLQVNCTVVECPQIYAGPDTLDAVDCDSLTAVCLNIPSLELSNYTISDNGEPYLGPLDVCRFDETVSYPTAGFEEVGEYALESWTFNGQVYSISSFTSVEQLVDSMRVWDFLANWQWDGEAIFGSNFGADYGDIIVSQNGVVIASSTPSSLLEASATSVLVDTGYHEIVVFNTSNGCTETIEVFIDCIPFTGTTFDSTLMVMHGETDIFCFDVSGLGTVTSVINICPEQSNGDVGLTIIPGTEPCVSYTGQLLGLDTFCLQICDANIGFCDTTTLVIGVEAEPDTLFSSLQLSFIDTVCLDTTIFAGTISQFNTFGFTPNLDVNLDEENYCVEFMGMDLGVDTLNIQICDDLGFCNTTTVFVGIGPQTRDTIFLEVLEERIDTICIDTTELFGDIISIDNYCIGASGLFVDFDIEDGFCVSAQGLLPDGVDTACIEICNEFGFCDTTIIVTNVVNDPTLDPPIAVADSAKTFTNLPVTIPVVENDILNNSMLVEVNFVSSPEHGMLVLNPDFTITYIPDDDFCGRTDSFTYFLMTLGGNATASVTIDVLCDEIIIFNGFSPNGDGINDTFKINGLENYASNKLQIFNRWGNRVFVQENYSNDVPFDGTWDGANLVDGTYFYQLEVKDTGGETLNFSGYLSLHR